MVADLESGHTGDCVPYAHANALTWVGQPTAAKRRTTDGYRNGDVRQPIPLGQRQGAAYLEREWGGRFQQVDGWAEIEARVKNAGPGSFAFVAYQRDGTEGSAHVTQVFYDGPEVPENERRFHYIDSEHGEPGHEPFETTGISTMSSFVIDLGRNVHPFPGRGPGIGNHLVPTEAYRHAFTADQFDEWTAAAQSSNSGSSSEFRPAGDNRPPAAHVTGGEQPIGPADARRAPYSRIERLHTDVAAFADGVRNGSELPDLGPARALHVSHLDRRWHRATQLSVRCGSLWSRAIIRRTGGRLSTR
jgi:hypothetical protein